MMRGLIRARSITLFSLAFGTVIGCAEPGPAQDAPGSAGRAPATGVEVEAAQVEMDAALLDEIDTTILEAIADSAAPGAALAIGRHGRLVRLRGYGALDWADRTPVDPQSIYDLASLTKVIGTTTAVMLLVDEGRLALGDLVVDHLPWWSRGDERKSSVTLHQLLVHRAGLPAFRRWFFEMEGREAYQAAIADVALERDPGGETVYSDIGVMTVALIVELVTGQRLDRFLEERLFTPLGMGDTGFLPSPDLLARIAPTEMDTTWRGELVRGRVHDENADAYGGVAGHAGLFSTVADLAVFADLLLRRGTVPGCDATAPDGRPCPATRPAPQTLISEATVGEFTRRADPSSSRAIGWDTPSGRSSAGDLFSAQSFGHTGYTGTSIWMDPERDLFVVLLTNRVNPTRENSRHVPLRRRVHDLAARAVVDVPATPRAGGSS